MDAAFNDDVVVISGLIFGFSLYFSLLFGNLPLETGSNPTSSSAILEKQIISISYKQQRRLMV